MSKEDVEKFLKAMENCKIIEDYGRRFSFQNDNYVKEFFLREKFEFKSERMDDFFEFLMEAEWMKKRGGIVYEFMWEFYGVRDVYERFMKEYWDSESDVSSEIDDIGPSWEVEPSWEDPSWRVESSWEEPNQLSKYNRCDVDGDINWARTFDIEPEKLLILNGPTSQEHWTTIQTIRSIYDKNNYLERRSYILLSRSESDFNLDTNNICPLVVYLKEIHLVKKGSNSVEGELDFPGLFDVTVPISNQDAIDTLLNLNITPENGRNFFMWLGEVYIDGDVTYSVVKEFLRKEWKPIKYFAKELFSFVVSDGYPRPLNTYFFLGSKDLDESKLLIEKETPRIVKPIFPNMKQSKLENQMMQNSLKWLKKMEKTRKTDLPQKKAGLLNCIKQFCERRIRVIHPTTVLEEFEKAGYLVIDEECDILFDFTGKDFDCTEEEFLQDKAYQNYKVIQRNALFHSFKWLKVIEKGANYSNILYLDTFLIMIEQQCCEVEMNSTPERILTLLIRKSKVEIDEEENVYYLLGQKMEIHFSDTGLYSEFSNRSPHFFDISGKSWKTVEHYLYSERLSSLYFQNLIRTTTTWDQARDLSISRKNLWRDDWEESFPQTLLDALEAKISQNPTLKKTLLKTKPHTLIYKTDDPLLKNNLLGRLLMQIRTHN